MTASATAIVTSQKATAAAGAAIGLGLAGPLIAKIPFANTPIGAIVVGVGIAVAAASWLGGHAESFVVGIGIGLAARGIVALAFPAIAARA